MNPFEICPQELCCGCMACANTCPCNAITFEPDTLAKLIPKIDALSCVSCKLCAAVCPMNNLDNLRKGQDTNPVCYALWTHDIKDKETCSSGGAATALARLIVENGGVVFGAAFGKNAENTLFLRHSVAEKAEDLEAFKGSKYVQSRTDDAYSQAKECLKTGREVLYISTPCQIAGLRSFLGCESYDNLYTVDLVCHGVPPMEYLSQYVHNLTEGQGASAVSFRGKRDFEFIITGNNRELYNCSGRSDLYFRAFLDSVIYRDNCYRCAFANTPRISDITVGDFWGLDRKTLVPHCDGRVSLALVNNRHGGCLIESAKHLLACQQRPLSEAVADNSQLREPARCPESDRTVFTIHYPKLGFTGAIEKTGVPARAAKTRRREYMKATKLGVLAKEIRNMLKGFSL